MSKQTAVQWLRERLNTEPFLTVEDFDQALAMEREQIEEAFKHGNLPTFLGRCITANEYFNETYGKEQNDN